VACCVLLGYIGSQPPEGAYVLAARFLTVYYYLFFLVILPLLGRYEKTKPLPVSIYDAVLGKHGHAKPADVNP
jgi:quinol-cytochrome oxidoreductase complex cytochrome b subunit